MRNIIILGLILVIGCKPNPSKKLTAQEIVNKSLVASGTDKVANSTITFAFRDKQYKAFRLNGQYQLERTFMKDKDTIMDLLSNNGFQRFVNKKLVELPENLKRGYSNSVNSVHYFSVLPFGLNDKAVNKKLLPSAKIKGKDYYKIQVTFNEEGGGEDFEDVFIYWIGKEDFLVDYLAYSYHTNGGGMRFRELSEQCIKNGIRFVDYTNYKPKDKNLSLVDVDKAFEEGNLTQVSEIILRNIEVK